MTTATDHLRIEKVETGIEGFDDIASGGLPKGRTTLVCGTAGSAKTVFAAQFLAEGIMQFGESGVLVTFEEHPEDLTRNLESLGWQVKRWQEESKWTYVDASPQPDEETVVSGEFDFGALIARIEYAVRKVGATRLVIDSLGAIFTQFADSSIVRRELFRIAVALKRMGVTAVLTAERVEDYGEIARFGVEEFVADNVVILRNVLEGERRRRTVEILKFRGTTHQRGEYPFTITDDSGIVVVPISGIRLDQKSSNVRISTGLPALDEMCGGGYFRDSIILVSGATGTGKTLMATEFISGGTAKGEKCLLLAFEESRDQLFRNASGWGMDYEEMESKGLLRVISRSPEASSLEDHLLWMKRQIEDFEPKIIAVDSLSALERVSSVKSFREFAFGITSFIKKNEMAGLLTAVTPTLMGGTSVTEAHISTITDSIILLRYVEIFGEMRRGLTVLKMRGSMHDKGIREYMIDGSGMHIGRPFRNVTGILSGNLIHGEPIELERVSELFKDEINNE